MQIQPALKVERLFETAVALAQEGRTLNNRDSKPLDPALFVHEFGDEVHGAFLPARVRRVTMAPPAAIARKRRHAERYTPPRPRLRARARAPAAVGWSPRSADDGGVISHHNGGLTHGRERIRFQRRNRRYPRAS